MNYSVNYKNMELKGCNLNQCQNSAHSRRVIQAENIANVCKLRKFRHWVTSWLISCWNPLSPTYSLRISEPVSSALMCLSVIGRGNLSGVRVPSDTLLCPQHPTHTCGESQGGHDQHGQRGKDVLRIPDVDRDRNNLYCTETVTV